MMKTCFQKSASAVGLGALLILCLTVITVLPQSKYAKPKKFDRTDLQSQADLEVVPAAATLPGEAVAAAEPAALAVVKVSMRNMKFYPQSLKVKKGTVVEWKNDDLVPHTATSATFDSGSLGAGKSWRHTFTRLDNIPTPVHSTQR
jgi:plastocyanin